MSMVILKNKKASKEEIEKMSYEYGSYIKVVVDIEKEILAGGGGMHYDEERLLLDYGCEQKNLWGGGIDLETGLIDYNSMINVRPNQDNLSRDIQTEEIRKKVKAVIEKLI